MTIPNTKDLTETCQPVQKVLVWMDHVYFYEKVDQSTSRKILENATAQFAEESSSPYLLDAWESRTLLGVRFAEDDLPLFMSELENILTEQTQETVDAIKALQKCIKHAHPQKLAELFTSAPNGKKDRKYHQLAGNLSELLAKGNNPYRFFYDIEKDSSRLYRSRLEEVRLHPEQYAIVYFQCAMLPF